MKLVADIPWLQLSKKDKMRGQSALLFLESFEVWHFHLFLLRVLFNQGVLIEELYWHNKKSKNADNEELVVLVCMRSFAKSWARYDNNKLKETVEDLARVKTALEIIFEKRFPLIPS